MKRLAYLFIALALNATPGMTNELVGGEVLTNKLLVDSSGSAEGSRFVNLPKGRWKILGSYRLSGSRAIHTGYLLESLRQDTFVPLLLIVRSHTSRSWHHVFTRTPSNAKGIQTHKTNDSPSITKQSFYFLNWSEADYQSNWLSEVKLDQLIATKYAKDNFALAVTRNFNDFDDLRTFSFVRTPATASNVNVTNHTNHGEKAFEAALQKWNDEIRRLVFESYYEKREQDKALISFSFDSGNEDTSLAELASQEGQVAAEKLTASLPPTDSASRIAQENRLNAELEVARLKLELEKALASQADPESQQPREKIRTEASDNPPALPTSENFSRRLALVIGNDDYKNVPKLENAVGDSKAISRLLDQLGYDVHSFSNLNEKQFKRSLRDFKQKLSGGEEVVFFFAGHGVQIGSSNFLLPTDTGSDSEDQIQDEGIPLQRVLDDFSERKAKFTLAMVDACRDNPFRSRGRSIGGRGLAATSAATGQMIIFSAGAGQQALDRLGKGDEVKNGLFTRVLISKVQQSSQPIHLLMREVRREVATLAKSVGHDQVPAIYDQVIGDFYFGQKKGQKTQK